MAVTAAVSDPSLWIAVELARQKEEAGDGSAKADTTLREATWIILIALGILPGPGLGEVAGR